MENLNNKKIGSEKAAVTKRLNSDKNIIPIMQDGRTYPVAFSNKVWPESSHVEEVFISCLKTFFKNKEDDVYYQIARQDKRIYVSLKKFEGSKKLG